MSFWPFHRRAPYANADTQLATPIRERVFMRMRAQNGGRAWASFYPRSRTERDLQSSVLSTMAEGVVVQDADGSILACNHAAERLLGLRAAQMTGLTSMDPRWRAVNEDGTPSPGEQHPTMVTLRTGVPARGVVMGVHRPDGTLVWLSINTQLIELSWPRRRAVLSTFCDVSSYKHVEQALRESEQRYRAIVDSSFEGIWIFDFAGDTTFANARMAELLDVRLDDLEDMSLWDFIADSERATAENMLRRAREGAAAEYEFCMRTRSGNQVWTSFATSAVSLHGTSSVLAMVRDITLSKHNERDLRASTDRLGRALAAGRMYAWEADIEDMSILWARNYQEVLGLAPDVSFEHVDQFMAVIHPDDRRNVGDVLAALIDGHLLTAVIGFRVIGGDGQMRWLEARAQRRSDPETGRATMFGTSVDVTSRKLLEDELLEARKLEALGRLAGGVAHDFNNLLTAMLAAVDFAEMGKGNIQEELHTVRVAAERAALLTGQLLAFARKQPVELRTVALDQLVFALEGVLRRLLGEQVELSVATDAELWPARADPQLVEQVLFNLIANARDALIGRGGRVHIAVRQARIREPVSGLAAGDYVCLSVHDDGPGMAAHVLEHVFEPFYTTKPRGTGLGLASCYGIVKQLGGHISAESGQLSGTTFTVHLPRSATELPRVTPKPDSHAVPQHATILLVEDEELIRRYAARGLEAGGYSVLSAESGEEALRLVAQHAGKIDALVSDVVLPRMSGPELADHLHDKTPRLPVLFVSGYTDDILRRHASLQRGARLLTKPYTIAQLSNLVLELLANARN